MLQTPLHDWHAENGGRMVDFAGWHMPVQYSSIVDEHTAVRTQAGLFDIAHMGRLKFTGADACAFLDRIVTNNVAARWTSGRFATHSFATKAVVSSMTFWSTGSNRSTCWS